MEKKTYLDILCKGKKPLFPTKEKMSYFEQGTKDYKEVVTFDSLSRGVSSSNTIISSLTLETKGIQRKYSKPFQTKFL